MRRLAEEGGGEAAELPDTVQALLAARLDSLEPARAPARPARRGGRPDLLGGRAGAASPSAERRELCARADLALRRRTSSSPAAAARLAGEREYAFKHVLIRDVAYGMLPEGRALPEALRGRPLHRGARRRPHRRGRGAAGRALRPRRRRSARRRGSSTTSSSRSTARRCTSSRPRATPRRRSTRTPRPSPTTRRRASCAARTTRRRSRGSARSRATSRCAWAVSTRRSSVWEECLEYHRAQEDLDRGRRPAPQDRRRPLAQGRAQAGDRALPEGHQPAQGRAALPGAGAPLRGGRLALHARGRQHARHLRLREGAAAGRADGRDARGQPRARHLRPRLRPHRRHREGAREPRALGRARRAAPTTARRFARC